MKKRNIKECKFKLEDQASDEHKDLEITVKSINGYILIQPKGYGDACSDDGKGWPIMVEKFDGRVRVVVWSDIMEEDATHTIDLEDAREDNPERIKELQKEVDNAS